MSEPSTFYAKPSSDDPEKISMMPIGINGLSTEPYNYNDYEGIGGDGEMNWFTFIAIILLVGGVLGGAIWLYLWYSRASVAARVASGIAQAVVV